MEKKTLKYAAVGTIVLSLIALLFNWCLSLGVVLGQICFRIYYLLLSNSFTTALAFKSEYKPSWLNKSIRMLVLALPMLLSFLFPDFINTWGVVAGLLMFKAVLIVLNVIEKKSNA